MMLIDHLRQKPEEVVPELNSYDRRAIAELEGPNEPNNKFRRKTSTQIQRQNRRSRHRRLHGRGVPVRQSRPEVERPAGRGVFGHLHRLQSGQRPYRFRLRQRPLLSGYGVPSSSLESNITRFNNILPAGSVIKPFVPTEFGYNVEADVANGTYHTGSHRAQALNIPMLLAEYFRHGIRRGYLFAIHNADGYGLLESDLVTKRTSYHALKNFLDQIREAKWNAATLKWEGARSFTPRALPFRLQGAPETVHSLTLQKSNGEYTVLLWNEVQNFDQNARKDLYPKPVPVTLKFGVPVGRSATILLQNDKGAYDASTQAVQNGALQLNVPSSVMMIKISAGALPRIAAPPAPQALTAARRLTKRASNGTPFHWPPGTSCFATVGTSLR
jgi:hypothetical protein